MSGTANACGNRLFKAAVSQAVEEFSVFNHTKKCFLCSGDFRRKMCIFCTAVPHIRFHDLRHTFATMALQNGVDIKTVSSMLGHYDAGFTLRTYTHATRQKQDEAAQTMGTFMAQVM